MSLPQTYSLDDVAAVLGKSRYWLASQVRAGKLPHLRTGRTVRFTEAHVQQILAAVEQRPIQSQPTARGLTPRSAARRRTAGVA